MNLQTAIGIDFGGTSIKPAVVRGKEILARGQRIDTQAFNGPDEICCAILAEVERLRTLYPDVVAIGLGMPGLINAVDGIVHGLTNVRGWHDVPLRKILSEGSGLPVAIDNDAKAMAYGEWRFGAANNLPNVACITLGTGIGGGLILNGQLHRGAQNGAGEIGQTSIHYQGVPAHFGNLGAVERYAGNQQIAENAVRLYKEAGIDRPLAECSPADLAKAANAGDPIAKAVWDEAGDQIGAALANLIWLINPNCIVLGGGVAQAGELIFEPIRKSIAARSMPEYIEHLLIVPAQLGSDAGVIGAAALGVDNR